MQKNIMADMIPESNRLNGIYRGVVEDRNDPLKMGRCKIRIFGIHTEEKNKNEIEGIPTSELPWAEPALGLVEGSISGYGAFSVPLQGSHVFLFFECGNILNPRYFASAPGIPSSSAEPEKGFNDPNGTYPQHRTAWKIGESDFHRLARGESTGTIVDFKNSKRDKSVLKAGGGTWSEPESAFEGEYPDNIVISTHSGIILEIDTTPASPRFHLYHPSNSYLEINKNGDFVIRNQRDRYEVIVKDKNIHVKGNMSVTVEKDVREKIGQNKITEINGSKKETIGKSNIREIKENNTEKISGASQREITGTESVTAGNYTIETGALSIGAKSGQISVDGSLTLEATGEITLIASKINLNP